MTTLLKIIADTLAIGAGATIGWRMATRDTERRRRRKEYLQ